jgi:hypothetical protein
MPVEESQDVDGHLAAVFQSIAELGRRELARRRGGRHSIAMRAMSSTAARAKKWSGAISSTSPRRAHETPHERLLKRDGFGDVAHTRWSERLASWIFRRRLSPAQTR